MWFIFSYFISWLSFTTAPSPLFLSLCPHPPLSPSPYVHILPSLPLLIHILPSPSLSTPSPPSISVCSSYYLTESVSDTKSRFLLKRFKVSVYWHVTKPISPVTMDTTHQLLEQALAVEEQLHRASNTGLVQDPNQIVMQLHSRQVG